MEKLDEQIVARIMRSPRPHHSVVIKGTTPVISFGDFTKSSVVTIGINPSSREFSTSGSKGKLLPTQKKRLQDFESLGISSYSDIGQSEIELIWQGCQNYFSDQGNPYNSWFGQFSPILEQLGVSYRDGGASHIDLVQWATSPAWSGFTKLLGKERAKSVQRELTDDDIKFFRYQNSCENINLRLINGATVLNQFKSLGIYDLVEDETIQIFTAKGPTPCSTYVGRADNGGLVLAWSTNIQALHGGNAIKSNVAQRISEWVAQTVERS